ncbi:MAG: secretin N-terminal domain-containing protein [Myxococcota bacterium]
MLVSICFLGAASAAAAASGVEVADIRFKYDNAPLSEIVTDVAQATGERFVFDPDLPGRFTIIIPRKVTPSEAFALLEATLVMQGYALVRGAGSDWQVMRIHLASSGAPWGGPVLEAERSSLITTMIQLERAPAADVASHLSKLLGAQDSVVAIPATNSLILTGIEKRLRRVIQLAWALDVASSGRLWIRTLRHRGAVEVSELVRGVMSRPEDSIEVAELEPIQIWLDERTNSLLLYGSDRELTRARAFIDTLDTPPDVDSKIQVLRIYHRDAEDIARRLLEMAIGRVLVGSRAAGAGENILGTPYAVVADPATNSIIVDADRDTMADLLGIVAELDRPQPRIQVDVIAYEVTNPIDRSLAINWFSPVIEPGGSDRSALSISSNPSGSGLRDAIGPDISFFGRVGRAPLVLPFVDDSGAVVELVLPGETAVISANDRSVQTRVLLQPRLTMVSGEEHRLFVGQNVPIPISDGAKASTSRLNTRIERHDVGIDLRIHPKLGEMGKVELDLQLEISRLGAPVAGSIDVVGPTLESRSIGSTISLSDGELAVLGLSQEGSRTGGDTGTPFLKDIPVFGTLFRSRGRRAVDTHLVFAVQVRILRTHDEDLAESIRQRLALERSQSRLSGLERSPGKPYALLVTTRSGEDDAEAIAESFKLEGLEVQVGRWTQLGEERFDVYLTGYDQLALAGADALQLRERGWAPQVVVLPGETALATPPPLRLLGSSLGAAARTDAQAP